jgi:hypothetical protein
MKAAFAFVAILSMAPVGPAFGEAYRTTHYDDVDFGIHADAPKGTTICLPPGNGHGFVVPLEDPAETIECDIEHMGAHLAASFTYNVPYEAGSTNALAAQVCRHGLYRTATYRLDRTPYVQCIKDDWQAGAMPALPAITYVVLRPYRKRPYEPEAVVEVAIVCPKNDCRKYTDALHDLILSMHSLPVSD